MLVLIKGKTMNGFNKLIVCLLLLNTLACTRQIVKETEGEGLFLIYRGVPKLIVGKLQIWRNLDTYLASEKNRIPDSAYRLISAFNEKFLILRLGVFSKNTEFFIENITYENVGTELIINLQDISSNMGKVSDIGYPIFIMNRNIEQIQIYTNDSEAFLTNI